MSGVCIGASFSGKILDNQIALQIKEKAKALRLKGNSVKRIAKKLGIAVSTSSLWMRDVSLPVHIEKILEKQAIKGRAKGWQVLRAMREHQYFLYRREALLSIRNI